MKLKKHSKVWIKTFEYLVKNDFEFGDTVYVNADKVEAVYIEQFKNRYCVFIRIGYYTTAVSKHTTLNEAEEALKQIMRIISRNNYHIIMGKDTITL